MIRALKNKYLLFNCHFGALMRNKGKALVLSGLFLLFIVWTFTLLDSNFHFIKTQGDDLGMGLLYVSIFVLSNIIACILLWVGTILTLNTLITFKNKSVSNFVFLVLGALSAVLSMSYILRIIL